MAKRDVTKEKLMALKELEEAPRNQEMEKKLRKTLAGKNNILVAKAAEIVAKRGIADFIPALLTAYDRFLENPCKNDRGCQAKEAITAALDDLEYDQNDFFLQGIKYRQYEPAYGRSVDTAAVLRGRCGFALVRLGCPDVVFELTDLLADPEPQACIAAARALSGISGDISEPLLRLKVGLSDNEKDHQVVAECLYVLVQINPDRSMGFVERFLNSRDIIIAENAAFAIGESRQAEAFELLRRHREKSRDPEFQDMLLTPMAVTRLEEAFDYLIDIIENGSRDSAVAAVNAVKIFGDGSHRSRTRQAVTSRNDEGISEAYAAWSQ